MKCHMIIYEINNYGFLANMEIVQLIKSALKVEIKSNNNGLENFNLNHTGDLLSQNSIFSFLELIGMVISNAQVKQEDKDTLIKIFLSNIYEFKIF